MLARPQLGAMEAECLYLVHGSACFGAARGLLLIGVSFREGGGGGGGGSLDFGMGSFELLMFFFSVSRKMGRGSSLWPEE